MRKPNPENPATKALLSCKAAFVTVAIFSAIVNVLMLTGSFYMLQVYDRVLPSRSVPTLLALTAIAAAAFILLGLFDWLRQRILSRIGLVLDSRLSQPVLVTILDAENRGMDGGTQLSRDLDSVRGYLSGLGPASFFDLPWIPLYAGLCFLLHPLLGWTLVAGAVVLISLALLTELMSRGPAVIVSRTGNQRTRLLESSKRNAEAVAAMGMGKRISAMFAALNDRHIQGAARASDVTTGLGTISKTMRFMLQSATLGMGAWLVMHDMASPGVMIAASVLSSRALAPVEAVIGSWRHFIGARQSWKRLTLALSVPRAEPQISPERPKEKLTLEGAYVAVPGASLPMLVDIGFGLKAGQGLAIIGPSGSGKSTLARALVGIRPLLRGELRLDLATLDQWREEERGKMLGYMPQDVQLFEGTIAQNIARFDPDMTDETVRAAAIAAGTYDMILGLPKGFETPVGEDGALLSGGQRQRIALARALYDEPFVVVLDEPNASLDAEGDAALTAAIAGIRQRGGIVIVIAHRPSALACIDQVLVLAEGRMQAFGPKAEVLKQTLVAAGQTQQQRREALHVG